MRYLVYRVVGRLATSVASYATDLQFKCRIRQIHLTESKLGRASQRDLVIASTNYDMGNAPGEEYYANQYWAHMREYLPPQATTGKILDLGCGQGRLSTRFASAYPNASITGVDVSESAIKIARHRALSEGLQNLDFRIEASSDVLERTPPNTIDIAVFTEVSFYHPQWTQELPSLVSSVRPGGLFVASFRSTLFNVMLLLQLGQIDDALRILKLRSGNLSSTSPMQFSWNNSEELRHILNEAGLDVLDLRSIGPCSGIAGDPHSNIIQPGALNLSQQQQLMEIELALSNVSPDAGRYFLVIAKRPAA